jgi:hypothetical protein
MQTETELEKLSTKKHCVHVDCEAKRCSCACTHVYVSTYVCVTTCPCTAARNWLSSPHAFLANANLLSFSHVYVCACAHRGTVGAVAPFAGPGSTASAGSAAPHRCQTLLSVCPLGPPGRRRCSRRIPRGGDARVCRHPGNPLLQDRGLPCGAGWLAGGDDVQSAGNGTQ